MPRAKFSTKGSYNHNWKKPRGSDWMDIVNRRCLPMFASTRDWEGDERWERIVRVRGRREREKFRGMAILTQFPGSPRGRGHVPRARGNRADLFGSDDDDDDSPGFRSILHARSRLGAVARTQHVYLRLPLPPLPLGATSRCASAACGVASPHPHEYVKRKATREKCSSVSLEKLSVPPPRSSSLPSYHTWNLSLSRSLPSPKPCCSSLCLTDRM